MKFNNPDKASQSISIPGSEAIIELFGAWPDFHDAEISSIDLSVDGNCKIELRVRKNEDPILHDGRLIQASRMVIIQFQLDDIQWLELSGFSRQNIVMDLSITKPQENTFELAFEASTGISGRIQAKAISVSIRDSVT